MDSLGGSLGAAEGQITLDASKALSALTQVSVGLRNLDQQSQKQGTGLLSWANKNEQALNTVGTGLLGVGAAFLGSFGLATKTSMNFDAAISAVGSVAGASSDQLAALREEALRLGADTTLGATEAAAAMEIMLKAGASLESVLNGGAEAAINLSEATGVDITLAAETAATAMNIFKTDAKTAADTIAQSANASSLDVNDWALALKAAGPIAKSLGLDMEDLGQAMVILGDAGIKGETGGTALRNILMGLADPAGEASLGLAELGVATHDAQGNFRGLEEVTHDLAGSWGSMDAAQKLQIATMIAGEQGAASFMAIMDAQAESVRNGGDAFQEASDRMDGTGTAASQAAARMDNLKGSWEQFMGSVETAAITFTSGLAPAMRFVVDGANTLLQAVLALPGPIKTVIGALTGIVGAAGVAGGGFLLLLPRIADTQKALSDLGVRLPNVTAGFTKLHGAFSNLGKSSAAGQGGIKGIGTALMGLARAHPILAGITAAAGLIGVAYATNFMGLRDGVQSVLGVFGKMRDAFNGTSGEAQVAAEDIASFAEATKVVDGKTVYTAFVTNADGTKREVGEIIESVANADGTTAQVLIEGEDGQYWATIDLATGTISNAEIPVTADTRSFTTKINDALESLKSSMAGSGFAFAIPLIEGIQAIVPVIASVAGAIGGFISSVKAQFDMFSQTRNPLAAIVAAIAASLSMIDFGPFQAVMDGVISALQQGSLFIQEVGNALGSVFSGIAALWQGHWSDAAGHFTSAFESIVSAKDRLAKVADAIGNVFSSLGELAGKGLDALAKKFPALAGTFLALGKQARAFGKLMSDVFSVISALIKGDWDAAWSAAKRTVSSAVSLIKGQFNVIKNAVRDVGNIFSTLGDLIQRGVGMAVDHLSTRFSSFANTIGTVGGVLSSLGGILSGIGDVLAGLMSGDWGRVWEGLGEAFTSAIEGIVAAALLIPTLILEVFEAVDWGALWEGIQEAASDAWDKVVEGVSTAWDNISSFLGGVDWGALWDGMISAARSTISSVVDAISSVDWSGFLQGAWNVIQNGLSLAWDAITSLDWSVFIPDFGEWADWITGKLASASDWGIAKFGGWSTWVSHKLSDISSWGIEAFAGWRSFISHGLSGIAAWGIETFSGWATWIKELIWPDWASSFIGWLGDHLPDWPSADEILQAVRDWLSGFNPFGESTGGDDPDRREARQRDPSERPIDYEMMLRRQYATMALGQSAFSNTQNAVRDERGKDNPILPGGFGVTMPSFDSKGADGLLSAINGLIQKLPVVNTNMLTVKGTTGLLGGSMQTADGQVKGAGTGIGGTFQGIAASALANFPAAQAIATSQFAAMQAGTLASSIGMQTGVAAQMAALQAGVTSQSTSARVNATSQLASMAASVGASALGMSAGVAARMAALQSSVTSQASSARANATSAFSTLASNAAGKFMGMQAQSAVQMALMAAQANTQGAAVNKNLSQGVSNAISNVRGTLAQLSGIVMGAGANAAWQALMAGANIGNSFASGMESALGRIQGAAAAMVAAAMVAVQAKAMIASPSKVFMRYGGFVGEGFALGITDSEPGVRSAINSLFGAASMPSPAFSEPFAGGYGGYGGGTQYIDNSTHTTEYIALNNAQFAELLQAKDRANKMYKSTRDPNALAGWEG